jgi:hypothetical protein
MLYDCQQRDMDLPTVRALVRAYQTADAYADSTLIIRLSSWNTLWIDHILKAFPDAPWMFIYRDPHQVMGSLLSRPSGWMQNRAALHAASPGLWGDGGDLRDNTERVLATYLSKVLTTPSAKRLLVNYAEFGVRTVQTVLEHFALSPLQLDTCEARRQSRIYSKSKTPRAFNKSDLNAGAEQVSNTALMDHYARLKKLSAETRFPSFAEQPARLL